MVEERRIFLEGGRFYDTITFSSLRSDHIVIRAALCCQYKFINTHMLSLDQIPFCYLPRLLLIQSRSLFRGEIKVAQHSTNFLG